MAEAESSARQGWTDSPDGRGTASIIWSCAITTGLCCWSVLIVNLPSPRGPKTGYWWTLVRKLMLLALCALAPEIIFQVALGQWLAAQKSIRLFRPLPRPSQKKWTLRHGFFAEMGGFHLRSSDYPDGFPVNSEQLHFLVANGYVEYPKLEESQIRDRDKVDTLLRLITLFQTLAFVVTSLVRVGQHLALTALELSVLAFVVMSSWTTYFWLRKPADVEEPMYLEAQTTIASILASEGFPPDAVYTNTPLDPIGRQEWSWSIMWSHGLNYLRIAHLGLQTKEHPAQRFHNTMVPAIHGWAHIFFAVVSMGYLAVFFAAWNFSFPTEIERTLWRYACASVFVSATLCFTAQQLFFRLTPPDRHRQRSQRATQAPEFRNAENLFRGIIALVKKGPRTLLGYGIGFLRNNSVNDDPALDAPLGAITMTWICGVFYCSARAYMFAADFAELRSLPASAYRSIEWSSLSPYVP